MHSLYCMYFELFAWRHVSLSIVHLPVTIFANHSVIIRNECVLKVIDFKNIGDIYIYIYIYIYPVITCAVRSNLTCNFNV
jgi:hypothetical protein